MLEYPGEYSIDVLFPRHVYLRGFPWGMRMQDTGK